MIIAAMVSSFFVFYDILCLHSPLIAGIEEIIIFMQIYIYMIEAEVQDIQYAIKINVVNNLKKWMAWLMMVINSN